MEELILMIGIVFFDKKKINQIIYFPMPDPGCNIIDNNLINKKEYNIKHINKKFLSKKNI